MPVGGAANSVFNRVETHHTINRLLLCETLKDENSCEVRWCIVGCLGHYPLGVTQPVSIGSVSVCFVVCWLVGVLCENCIVDASITQQTVGLHFVWLVCCVV